MKKFLAIILIIAVIFSGTLDILFRLFFQPCPQDSRGSSDPLWASVSSNPQMYIFCPS